MKRLWNALGKPAKDANYQVNAVKHIEKLEKGEVKTESAPKHVSERKHFENAQKDGRIRDELSKKHDKLVGNMNKITIKSTNPPERWTKSKDLPTRENEFMHKNDPVWEYGFYEPPLDKMPKGKIMLREAMEVLRKMQISHSEGDSPVAAKMRENALSELIEHEGVKRIGREKAEILYEYLRPFERREEQKVVSRHELARLQSALQGRGDEYSLTGETHQQIKRLFNGMDKNREWNDKLSQKEKDQLDEAIRVLRSEEHERLTKRLDQINEDEKNFAEAVKQAAEKSEEKKIN
ncbi:hypothetical protein PENTCL1PPCAC_17936 [Pristionchus entomophagus]|uniref:Uncharacterized protein n=1 Tax=Pristionchus entomophagus TaxID=358040 RepID=A0AAV5TN77_9BILA|nr:hypothetical protein PENTCL1PPCAC_17936 [Pristionchus entomophagus]